MSQVASDRCPDILVLADALYALRPILYIEPSDEMEVQLLIRQRMKVFQDQADAAPSAWCDDVLTYFGPGGSMMPGLLKRR